VKNVTFVHFPVRRIVMNKTLESELQLTADGSHTLFVPDMDEHYHSVNGAKTESMHIFIQAGLRQTSVKAPNILEIGFGTGLNAFLTLLESEYLHKDIHFTSIELYPLPVEIIQKLNYPEVIAPDRAADYFSLHSASWNKNAVLPTLLLYINWKMILPLIILKEGMMWSILMLLRLTSNRKCGRRNFLILFIQP